MYPKKLKSRSQRDICTTMFTPALFTIVKIWKPPKCLRTDDKQNAMDTHNRIFSALEKKTILALAGGHHFKWNKPDPGGQRLHDTTYMRNLKWSNSAKQSGTVVVRGLAAGRKVENISQRL